MSDREQIQALSNGAINMKEQIGEYYPIEGLTPHPKNPRHNDEAVSQIARSIERFGFTSPIIAREQDKTIIAGHTRWKAAQKIGLSKVPVIFVNLSIVDAELLMIADNKLGEKAEWDTDKLSDLLTELRDQGEDLDVLGFEKVELANLLTELETEYGENDPYEEYVDMPEYINDDQEAKIKIIMKFESIQDFNNFKILIKQDNITEKTASTWYPKKEKQSLQDWEY